MCGCMSCGSRMMSCAHCEHAHGCSHQITISRSVGVVRSVFSFVLSLLGLSQSLVQQHPLSFRLHAHHACTSACSHSRATCACHTRVYSVRIGLRGYDCLHTCAVQHCCDLFAPMSLLYSTGGPFLLAMSHWSQLKHHLLHH